MAEVGRIVVGVDGSAIADHALRWAVAEGRARNAEVVALLAWGYLDQHFASGDGFDPNYGANDAQAALEAFVDRALGPEGAGVTRSVVCDLPARALLDAARESDLFVVGARGLGGFDGLLLGSVSQRCVHLAEKPLVIVRAGAPVRAFGRTVVGVDGSEASRQAVLWAIAERGARGGHLTVLHAFGPTVSEDAARQLIDEIVDGLDNDSPSIERRMVRAGASEALIDASKGSDLLIVGNHGHGGLGGVLVGSVAQQTAHHAHCPIALIPSPRLPS